MELMGCQRRSSYQKFQPNLLASLLLAGACVVVSFSLSHQIWRKLLQNYFQKKTDRQYIISGSIGYYEYLCHDCQEEDDMTPAEYYGLLIKMTDAELIADNDVFFVMTDTNETLYVSAEDFHDTWSSYIPEEYWIK